jgi:hypothetical protein
MKSRRVVLTEEFVEDLVKTSSLSGVKFDNKNDLSMLFHKAIIYGQLLGSIQGRTLAQDVDIPYFDGDDSVVRSLKLYVDSYKLAKNKVPLSINEVCSFLWSDWNDIAIK